MKKKSLLEIISETRFIHVLISVLLGFIAGAFFLVIMGIPVAEAYGRFLSPLLSVKGLSYIISYAAPYILTGLSVTFAFKAGIFNIGAEGQYVMGSIAAAACGIIFGRLPKPVLIPLCFLSAMAAGMLWGIMAGYLKFKRGVNEVVSMIMFNWIAFYLSNYLAGLPALKSVSGAEATNNISENAMLLLSPEIIKNAGLCFTANWSILIAAAFVFICRFLIEKTDIGYELKAVGYNKNAAEYGGIDVKRSMLTAFSVSGALSGLAGAVQLMGVAKRVSIFSAQEGFGFAGIIVALIGCQEPFGVFAAGIFYALLSFGGSKLNLSGAPKQLVSVITGTIIFFISISVIFRRIKNLRGKEAKEC